MPRYFFHLRAQDGRRIADETGSDMADEAAALHEAICAAHDLAADAARSRRPADKKIELTNNAGQVLHSVSVLTVIE